MGDRADACGPSPRPVTSRIHDAPALGVTGSRAGRTGEDLDRSLVSGVAWVGGMRTVTQGIQWIAALIVVRLLTPADYGLVGMAQAYLGVVRMVSEFGLGAALIQHHDLTESQIARISGASVLFATFLAAVSVALSGLVAGFFGQSEVRNVIIVLSVRLVLGGLEMAPRSLLRRDLRFRTLAMVQAAENLTYAATSLILAALGNGYWSLVWGALAGGVARTTAAAAANWHPIAWPRDLRSIKEELWFGWHVMVARLALGVRLYADAVIVGRFLGKEALGAYNVGWTQANLPVDRVTSLVSEVTPSVLAAARHDASMLRRYLRILTEGIALYAFPATLGLAVVADDFVLLVFGQRWAEAINPLRILAVAAAMQSLTPYLSQILITAEQPKRNMQFNVVAVIVLPILFFAGSHWGITGVAAAWLVGYPALSASLLLPHALRAVNMPVRDYFQSLRPAALAGAGMVAAVLTVRVMLPDNVPLAARLAIEIATGAGVYGVAVFSSYGRRLAAVLSLLRSSRAGTEPPPLRDEA